MRLLLSSVISKIQSEVETWNKSVESSMYEPYVSVKIYRKMSKKSLRNQLLAYHSERFKSIQGSIRSELISSDSKNDSVKMINRRSKTVYENKERLDRDENGFTKVGRKKPVWRTTTEEVVREWCVPETYNMYCELQVFEEPVDYTDDITIHNETIHTKEFSMTRKYDNSPSDLKETIKRFDDVNNIIFEIKKEYISCIKECEHKIKLIEEKKSFNEETLHQKYLFFLREKRDFYESMIMTTKKFDKLIKHGENKIPITSSIIEPFNKIQERVTEMKNIKEAEREIWYDSYGELVGTHSKKINKELRVRKKKIDNESLGSINVDDLSDYDSDVSDDDDTCSDLDKD
jgi:hypothetical protein